METTKSLRGTDGRVRDVADAEERLEDRMNLIQDEVKQIRENLNTVIKRMNDFHKWMDMTMDKDLRCHEENDLGDNEQNIKN